MAVKKIVKEMDDAILRDNVDALKELLEGGGDPNALVSPKSRISLLHKAASRPEMVAALLSHGADPNVPDSSGATPLVRAVRWQSLDTVKVLVAGGADLELGTNFEETPLIQAVSKGQLEIARFLLDAGADVNARSSFGKTPLVLAKQSGSAELIELVRKNWKENQPPPDANEQTTPEKVDAMFEAIEKGDVAAVEALLSDGVSTEVYDSYRNTALMKAAFGRQRDIFDVLVRAGANLHGTRGLGQTVLTNSISKEPCSDHMVKTILADGVTKADNPESALSAACRVGNQAVVQRLIEYGVRVNPDDSRKPPLYEAVTSNHAGVVCALIDGGARTDIRIPKSEWSDDDKPFWGKPLLALADARGYTEVAAALRKAGAPEPKPAAPRSKKAQPISDSWKRIAKWLKKNADGWKPMKRKATEKQLEKAESELELKFPADLRGSCAIHNGSQDKWLFLPVDGQCAFCLNTLNDMIREHRSLCDLLDIGEFEGDQPEVDAGIRAVTWHRSWVPFASNGGGDHLCIDLSPAKGGKKGQVISVGFDDTSRRKVANSLKDYLYDFANQMEDGRFTFNGECIE